MKKIAIYTFLLITFAFYTFIKRSNDSLPLAIPATTPEPTNTTQPSLPTVTPLQNHISLNPTAIPLPTALKSPKLYKDGSFTGSVADAYYGNIQVRVIIQNGKITDVQFLQYPNDRDRSIRINTFAMPLLKQEAIQAQNAQVDIVSGATDSSQAFIESLSSALSSAKPS
jgi:uncharacterized protein with FMN-binding domain